MPITFRDLLEVCDARDVATIQDVIEIRRIMRKGPPEAGDVTFHA